MAGITFPCPDCGKPVASDDSLCGQAIVCNACGKDIQVPIPGLEPGMEVGDFKLLEPIGSGAMGEVWLAEQTSMNRRVALKVLFPHLASDRRFVDRFDREVKNSAKLSHPNIVTAFHAGRDKGVHYLAISFVKGRSIEEIIEDDGPFSEKDALKIILALVSALEYAWEECRILHRDIKPSNIILNEKGIPMLLDMGISKSLDEDTALTMTGTVVGTPYYMSPEQAVASEDLDFRTDMYSLGATLYHMLSGVVPFDASTAMAIIMKHINDAYPPIREKNIDISVECEALLKRMMEKEREKRPSSWSELSKDIELVLEGKPPNMPLPLEEYVDFGEETYVGMSAISPMEASTANKIEIGDATKMATQITFDTSSDNPTDNRDQTEKPKGKDGGGPPSGKDKKTLFIVIGAAIVLACIAFIAIAAITFMYFGRKAPESPASPTRVSRNSRNSRTNDSIAKNGSSQSAKGVPAKAPSPGKDAEKELSGPEADFVKFADNFDVTKNTSLHAKTFWSEHSGSEHTWSGKVAYVKGGIWKAEIGVACPGRMLYKRFNVILVTSEKSNAAKLKIGQTITFKGNVYNYKPKSNGAVIVYMKNVKLLDIPDGEE